MSNLYIYGAGGHAKVIAEIAELSSRMIKGAVDKNLLRTKLLEKYTVALSFNDLEIDIEDKFIIAIGNNAIRKRVVEEELIDREFDTLIHPRANISSYAEIDEGTVVMAGVSINPDVQIGKHCIINTNASIDHDCFIGDYVHISPNVALAGDVFVGANTHIGIGATVIQGIKIGRNCTVGAGAVIIRDIPDGSTIVGNPGRDIKK